jgi:hypothetical protein
MAQDKHDGVSEREQAMMAAFANTMRTVMDPILTRIEQLEARAVPKAEEKLSPDEIYAKLMADIRGQSEDLAKIGLVEVVEGCTSDLGAPDKDGTMHGASFDAELQFKPLIVGGKVMGKTGVAVVKRFARYELPAGIDKHQRDGGLVPDGMTMQEIGANGTMRESDGYKQWVWETFLQADTRRFVGKALPAHVRPTAPAKTGT